MLNSKMWNAALILAVGLWGAFAAHAARAAELRMATDKPNNIVFAGHAAALVFSVADEQTTAGAADASLRVRLEDLSGAAVLERAETVSVPAGGGEILSLDAGVLDPGWYRARAVLKLPGGDTLKAGAALAVIVPFESVSPDSPFGMNRGDPQILRMTGIAWVRMDVRWRNIEKHQGVFDFTGHDERIDALRAQGVSVLGILNSPPEWAERVPADYEDIASGPHQGWGDFPPRDLAEWGDFVEKTVTYFRGRITHWEIWNEPFPDQMFFNGGTVQDYADIMKATYERGKAACPECVFIGLGGTTYLHAQQVYDAGGFPFQDAASIHIYQPGMMPEKGYFIEHIDSMFAVSGSFGGGIPIWLTESGWPTNKGMSEYWQGISVEDQARFLVRSHVLALTHGIDKFFWYCYRNGGNDITNFEDNQGVFYHDMTPKPAYAAYATMARMLDRTAPAGPVREFAPGAYAGLFQRDNGEHVFVLWTRGKDTVVETGNTLDGARVTAMTGADVAVQNANITLTQSPLYIMFPDQASAGQFETLLKSWIGSRTQ